jgi:hypothetical protein
MRRAVVTGLTVGLMLAAAGPAAAQPACGDVITEDTTLTADLDCRFQTEGGLLIGAPGVTLDLGSHRISTFGVAVDNPGHANVTVRNGSISADTAGIRLVGVTGNSVRDVELDGLVDGIVLEGSDHNRIVSNQLRSVMIRLDPQSDRNLVRDNVLTAREGVIQLRGGYNRVIHNIVWTGDDIALLLAGAHHSDIRDNTLVSQFFPSLRAVSSNDNELAKNDFVQYGDQSAIDVALTDASRNVLRDNHFSGGPVGLSIRSGADNVVRRNAFDGAISPASGVGDGVVVEEATTGAVIAGNLIRRFGDDGIDAQAAGTLLRRNTVSDNGDLGIEAVAGVIDGGGNRASGNGNPLQCVNVFCR